MKKLIRHLDITNTDERERVRERLNNAGFYVLTAAEGLDVYAIETRQTIEEKFIELWRKYG